MARYALYRISDGFIINVIVIDDPNDYTPNAGLAVQHDPDSLAQIGGTWDGNDFVPAPPPPPPPPYTPTLEERIAALEADFSPGKPIRIAIERVIQEHPGNGGVGVGSTREK